MNKRAFGIGRLLSVAFGGLAIVTLCVSCNRTNGGDSSEVVSSKASTPSELNSPALGFGSAGQSSRDLGRVEVGHEVQNSADLPEPNPELTPQDVVRLQLEALQHHRADGYGIAVAYRFASPRNKQVTGPFERFASTIRGPEYEMLHQYQNADLSPVSKYQGYAQQLAVLESADGQTEAFLFVMSRQSEAPYRDCWMTDAVLRGKMAHTDPSLRILEGR